MTNRLALLIATISMSACFGGADDLGHHSDSAASSQTGGLNPANQTSSSDSSATPGNTPGSTEDATPEAIDPQPVDLTGVNVCTSTPNILVFGDHQPGQDGLVPVLEAAGGNVAVTAVLPQDLSGYDAIFHVGLSSPLRPAEGDRLVEFVERGGALHLTGERPCCDIMNASLHPIVHRLTGNANIVIGQQGDVRAAQGFFDFPYLVNPQVNGALAVAPNTVDALFLVGPGALAGVANGTVLAVGENEVPVAAVWRSSDLVGGAGTLSVIMDVDWMRNLHMADNQALLENVVGFMCGATPGPIDDDGDGVDASVDCDDNDHRIGTLLYANDFSQDDGFFSPTEQLNDPWDWDGSVTSATDGGQQAQIGLQQDWDDVVVFAKVSAFGTESNCGNGEGQVACESNDRWRTGVVLRAAIDEDQDEGYHGYRCALASNAENGCFEEGLFLQVAEFMDAPEDDIRSECNADCPPNTTFDQHGRQNHELIDLGAGDTGYISFYAVGNQLHCEARNENGDIVVAQGTDDSFASGTVGLSTLNIYGAFDHIVVCEALALPVTALR